MGSFAIVIVSSPGQAGGLAWAERAQAGEVKSDSVPRSVNLSTSWDGGNSVNEQLPSGFAGQQRPAADRPSEAARRAGYSERGRRVRVGACAIAERRRRRP